MIKSWLKKKKNPKSGFSWKIRSPRNPSSCGKGGLAPGWPRLTEPGNNLPICFIHLPGPQRHLCLQHLASEVKKLRLRGRKWLAWGHAGGRALAGTQMSRPGPTQATLTSSVRAHRREREPHRQEEVSGGLTSLSHSFLICKVGLIWAYPEGDCCEAWRRKPEKALSTVPGMQLVLNKCQREEVSQLFLGLALP